MKLIRFVGIEELDALLLDRKIAPIKPRRDCLYFFPNEDIDGIYECLSIPYRLQYLTGIVAEHNAGDERLFICFNIELNAKKLEYCNETYADPEGSFFDTMLVGEYHSKNGYKIGDVKSIDIWEDEYFWDFKCIKHFDDLRECSMWLHYQKKI